MESTITYNQEVMLSAPDGGLLDAIMVTVAIDPPDAGVLICGRLADGNLGFVEVSGASNDIDLPFAKPQIYIKYLRGLKQLNIATRGFRMRR